MYSLFFYFSNSDLQRILEFINFLNKGFEKYFGIKYDGLDFNNVEEFLNSVSKEEKEAKEIWGVRHINGNGPHNIIKFWDDSFYISTEISCIYLENLEKESKIEETQKKFIEEMFKNLPLLGAVSIEEENPFHISEIFLKTNLDYIDFAYKKENGEIKFKKGKNKK